MSSLRTPVAWDAFAADRATRIHTATAAARALEGGNGRPALALLGPWRLGPWAPALARLLAGLGTRPPVPSTAMLHRSLAPCTPPAPPRTPAASWLHRAWLEDQDDATFGVLPDGADALAWGLEQLAWWGQVDHELGDLPWQSSPEPDPTADLQAARIWAAFGKAEIHLLRPTFQALAGPEPRQAFFAVHNGRGLPPEVLAHARAEFDEGLWWSLLGQDEASVGWRELAARLLEDAGPGPMTGMAQALTEHQWVPVGLCAVTRGHGRSSADIVFPEPRSRLGRARELARAGQEQPEALAALTRFHILSRLVESWRDPERTSSRRSQQVLSQNKGRARARLRAVIYELPAATLIAQVLALDCLGWRTRRALRRYARDFAWQQVEHGLSFHEGLRLDLPCTTVDGELPELSEAARAVLPTWVLLVCLKGRLPLLSSWCRTGRQRLPGDHRRGGDTTFGLLLTQIPEPLLEDLSRQLGLERLRVTLLDELDDILGGLQPLLEALAVLPTRGAALGPAVDALLDPHWHSSVARPQVRYRSYCAAAAEVVAGLELPEWR